MNTIMKQAPFDPMWTLYRVGDEFRAKTPFGLQALRSKDVQAAQQEVAEMRNARYDRALREWVPYRR